MCVRFDYCGISLLIVGSFIPWLYYGFYCSFVAKVIYLTCVICLGSACMIVSLVDKFGEPEYRMLRAGQWRRTYAPRGRGWGWGARSRVVHVQVSSESAATADTRLGVSWGVGGGRGPVSGCRERTDGVGFVEFRVTFGARRSINPTNIRVDCSGEETN